MGREVRRAWLSGALACLLLAPLVLGAAALAQAVPDALFASDEPVALSLTTDLRALEQLTDGATQQEATLSWYEADGEPHSLAVQLRPRGHSRRQLCDFPPLRLNLPKGEVDQTLFAQQDKLKLVTHCVSMGKRSRNAKTHVALEYLAYRMLNQLTEISFKVRPLQITYVDSRTGRAHEHVAFVIEHKRRLAARLGLSVVEADSIAREGLEPQATQRVDLFQYLIGNTDYSIVAGEPGEGCCHNAIALQGEGQYLPVPYDFDMSGLVNKPEAKPQRRFGIRSVRQRLYRGYCRDERYLDLAVEQYLQERAGLEAELERTAELFALSKPARMMAAKYLDDFYGDVLLQPAQLERKIKRRCRE